VNGYPQTVTESAAHQRPSDLDALEHDAIVALAGPLAQQRHRPLSQSEQDRAWEDGGDWYDDRLVVFSDLNAGTSSPRRHLTNIIRIIRAEWLDWLSKGRRKTYATNACNRAGAGSGARTEAFFARVFTPLAYQK
jgi:hypothetical protein